MGLVQSRESKLWDDFLGSIESRFREIENQLLVLRADDGAKFLKLDESNVSNPPTDAELDAIFGIPSSVGKGFTSFINDAGSGSNFYMVVSDGASWWVFTGTKAV